MNYDAIQCLTLQGEKYRLVMGATERTRGVFGMGHFLVPVRISPTLCDRSDEFVQVWLCSLNARWRFLNQDRWIPPGQLRPPQMIPLLSPVLRRPPLSTCCQVASAVGLEALLPVLAVYLILQRQKVYIKKTILSRGLLGSNGNKLSTCFFFNFT